MPAGGTIKMDATLALIFGKKEGDTITGMDLSKGFWTYIKSHKLQIGADGKPVPEKVKK
jgi:hypothetical protein